MRGSRNGRTGRAFLDFVSLDFVVLAGELDHDPLRAHFGELISFFSIPWRQSERGVLLDLEFLSRETESLERKDGRAVEANVLALIRFTE